MSEPNTPKKDGGLKVPSQAPAEPPVSTTNVGETRDRDGGDVEREDSPGGREGGMIGEG